MTAMVPGQAGRDESGGRRESSGGAEEVFRARDRLGHTRPVSAFVYVKVPAASLREHELHAALEGALTEEGLGSLVGWGASVDGAATGGRLKAVFHRIDIEVFDLPRALEVLKARLTAFGVPQRCELHYTLEGEALQQEYGPDGWSAGRPTTAAHRGRR